ncbi:hypothetical protein [Rhodococcus sp. YH1]|uniref:hypothetical protein n=1 Tax=Rhodococcus sp. YH1 TaxID=89066 RepID=UPI001386B7BD|nr:hypothetical protein [Rhodococcus sp. YH1]
MTARLVTGLSEEIAEVLDYRTATGGIRYALVRIEGRVYNDGLGDQITGVDLDELRIEVAS